jgi:ribosomal protein S3
MSSTPGEFRRAMFHALGDAVSADGDGLLVSEGEVRLRFALSSVEAARVGALQLNNLRVDISVLQGSAEAASALLARIDRATQRGGG